MCQTALLPTKPLHYIHFFVIFRPYAYSSSINVYSLHPVFAHYIQAWIDLLPVGGTI